jgi:endoglucanase
MSNVLDGAGGMNLVWKFGWRAGLTVGLGSWLGACSEGGGQYPEGFGMTGGAEWTPAGGSGPTATDVPAEVPVYPANITGLHVEGNQIRDDQGRVVLLRGVNRSGTEYSCIHNQGVFEGLPDETSIQSMKTWNVNVVRIPLNESCWLAINGAPEKFSGDTYKQAIKQYVNLLHKHDVVPILDLHWVGPAETLAARLQPMPDADYATAFWTDVAQTFLDDTGVVFEPMNEPFPNGNRDNQAAWQCWRDGCTATYSPDRTATTPAPITSYRAVGFQELVTAIRDTGAKHLILLGGVQYSNALTQWAAYKPTDPLNNLAAAWHIYNFNACANQGCWDGAPATLAASYPIVVTEFGGNDCTGNFVTPLMPWLDGHGIGYLAWTWNTWGACAPGTPDNRTPGQPWALISDGRGTPNSDYALAVRDHLLSFLDPK